MARCAAIGLNTFPIVSCVSFLVVLTLVSYCNSCILDCSQDQWCGPPVKPTVYMFVNFQQEINLVGQQVDINISVAALDFSGRHITAIAPDGLACGFNIADDDYQGGISLVKMYFLYRYT